MELGKLSLLSRPEPAAGPLLGAEARARVQLLRRQLTLWGALSAIFGVLAFVPLVWYVVNQTAVKNQIQAAAELQIEAARLQRFAPMAAAGNPAAFPVLREIDQTFRRDLDEGGPLAQAPQRLQPLVAEVNGHWQEASKGVTALVGAEKPLTGLEKNARAINAREAEMLELSEQILATLAQGGATGRELYYAGQLVAFATRIPQAARQMLSQPDPARWAAELESGQRAYQEALRVLGAAGPARERAEKLAGVYAAIGPDINALAASAKVLASAKQTAAPLIAAGEKALPESSRKLSQAFGTLGSSGLWEGVLSALLAAFAAGFVIMFTRVLVDDAHLRQRQSDEENQRHQGAILRLLDEMGALAEGDLTVAASVTEDMTGAIADSINFTVGELRAIVQRINQTTERVAEASREAQSVSTRLLAAAQKQSEEIKDTTNAVLTMARSINQVSESAAESAKVAERSLGAAQKGAAAVQNAISGMNEIRGHIQETAKRIKRLGESSQEIDEIVELISDITEQTNVLALNAAIQAASAGEAGRGFSVVAEEVQRLAERSAQATKQIGGIVKTIQADTQDAVAAMERSTQGVVEGTRLSDAAGQALVEIGKVSRDLAELIASISSATRVQADSASQVAANMRDILAITEQTTEGTKRTATSIGELSGLASELRGSVANFKV